MFLLEEWEELGLLGDEAVEAHCLPILTCLCLTYFAVCLYCNSFNGKDVFLLL